jgi:TonB family protein
MRCFLPTALLFLSCLTSNAEDTPRKLVRFQAPTYPAVALAMSAAGEVKLDLEIDENGRVTTAVPTGGHPLLRRAAADAARQWRFAIGKPANIEAGIIFTLGSRNRTVLHKPYRLEYVFRTPPLMNTIDNDSSRLAFK